MMKPMNQTYLEKSINLKKMSKKDPKGFNLI